MKRYKVNVVEDRTYSVDYIVKADNADEALEKALGGDTIQELDQEEVEVTDREAHATLEDVSELSEPKPAEVKLTPLDLCEAAACLWEAAIQRLPLNNPLDTLIQRSRCVGTSALRIEICGLSEACEREYQALSDDERDNQCFDWDFVPAFLLRRYPIKEKLSFTQEEAMRVINARLNGVWDDPLLRRLGELGDFQRDITRIMEAIEPSVD